jgi:single-stranded-DNA-specific exonuclease
LATAQWSVAGAAGGASHRLESVLGISSTLARVLAARGFSDPTVASAYLNPTLDTSDVAPFPGVRQAVGLLRAAQRQGRRIAVYGDYDADGVIGTVILRDALSRAARRGRRRGAGDPIEYYIPDRSEEGYGLNEAAIYHLSRDRGVDLLVTVDCGIRGHREIEYARSLGMEVIVTDHHLPGADLPPAQAIVHPALAEGLGSPPRADGEPWGQAQAQRNGEPCGALVALKLAYGLLGDVDPAWLDLAAVATVADIVPLLGENRALVAGRLPYLPATPNLGLRTLIERAAGGGRALTARDVAFAIVPRINAMGRVGDAKQAVEAFCAGGPLDAQALVEQMERDNVLRRAQEDDVLAQARLQLSLDPSGGGQGPLLPAALVAAGAGWYVGVVGIVASRLARQANRPAAVVAVAVDEGIGYGSARSVPGCDLYQAMSQCGPLLDRFGGHRQAVGFRLRSGNIGPFAAALSEAVSAQGPTVRRVDIDTLVNLSEVGESTVRDLARLEPTGQSNPAAVLGAAACEVRDARRVGQDGSHFKLTVRQGTAVMDAIAFGAADQMSPFCVKGGLVDLAFSPEVNEYQGRRTIQLRVSAARPAEPGLAARAEA